PRARGRLRGIAAVRAAASGRRRPGVDALACARGGRVSDAATLRAERAAAHPANKRARLEAIASSGLPLGPQTVHIDVTNACNVDCVTCWDHSPHLHE